MPGWGLSLGGGGVLGFSHLGVLQVMQEHGLKPSYLAGTSAGALVAALYALGTPVSEILSAIEATTVEPLRVLRAGILEAEGHLSIARSGLIPGRALESLLVRLTGGRRLPDLELPTSIVSVDLVSGDTVVFTSLPPARPSAVPRGRTYVTDVSIAEALRASISIPVLFEPKRFGGRILVDGGVKELVPAYEVLRMGADDVVAVDVSSASDKPAEASGLIQVLLRTFSVMEREATRLHLSSYASLVIQPDTGSVPWIPRPRDIRRLIEAGRRAANASIQRWLTIAGTGSVSKR